MILKKILYKLYFWNEHHKQSIIKELCKKNFFYCELYLILIQHLLFQLFSQLALLVNFIILERNIMFNSFWLVVSLSIAWFPDNSRIPGCQL